MTTTLLTPVTGGKAERVGASLWRRQLLPIGDINYEGRKISFTRDYLARLVQAFRDKAYDAVPFQFADADNKHNSKPEQRRGTVRDLELTDDGLDVIVEAGKTAQEYLGEYPDLGISASIVEAYDRADGKFFPAAIKHVLGTLDPRLTGMRPWQPVTTGLASDLWQCVDFSGDDGEVIDLSGAEYAAAEPARPRGKHAKPQPQPDPTTRPEPPAAATPTTEEHDMALTPDQEARLGRLLDLPDDKFEALLADKPEEDELLSDAELEALLDGLPVDPAAAGPGTEPAGETAPEGEPALAGAALSAEAQAAIDLANSRAEEQGIELARITAALDRATYEKERDALARDHGIPPRITDLARPLLEGTGRVVELANGPAVDAGAIVRKVLAEIGKTVKMLDLAGEIGSPLDFSAEAEAAAEEARKSERAAVVSGFRQMTGI
jgi:hypothetical protein